MTRPSLAHYSTTQEELAWRAADILGWIAAGKLKLLIHRSYPLREAPQAHRALESRQTKGKLLMVP